MMSHLFLGVCVTEMVIAGVVLYRLVRGPSVADRVVALNMVSVQCAVAVLFYGAYADRTIYLDVAIWMSSFSYLAALVWARYLERGLL